MMWGIGWDASWVAWIFMAAVWATFIVGVVWLVRGLVGPPAEGTSNARRILEERFAAGEISPEEFDLRRRALR